MKRLTAFKRDFLKFCLWAEAHWISLVVATTTALLVCLVLAYLSWLVGYWCNGLLGTHFDLNSCWAGIGAIGTGMLSVAGMAGAAWSKYKVDSALNSAPGEPPKPLQKLREMIK